MDELDALGAGQRSVSMSREISKKFEETWRGSVSSARLHLGENEPKGEYVVVIAARPPGDETDHGPDDAPARKKSRPPAGF
jgi:16S rRNA (cytidine1402-2'-O)-methyltransferase